MTPREFRERLQRRARKADVGVPPALAEALERYFRLLERWNQHINLTALPLKDATDETVDRLLVEPLVAARFLGPDAAVVLDIGSGGGSPAIPLKLAVPGIHLRLVESKTRKSAFLREAIRHLELTDTSVETARWEELLARPDLHEASDVVTVRAVRVEVRVLMGLQAFVRPGGRLFLFRGRSGPNAPAGLTPPLLWEGTSPIGVGTGSRLVVLRKATLGVP